MTILRNGFDGGTSGQAISVANSGGTSGTAFDDVGATPWTYTSTSPKRGARCAQAPTNNASYILWNDLAGGTRGIRSQTTYVKLGPTNSTTTANYLDINMSMDDLATAWDTFIYRNPDGSSGVTVFWTDFTDYFAFAAPAVTLPVNQWFRVETRIDISTTSEVAECRVFLDPDSTVPTAESSGVAELPGLQTWSSVWWTYSNGESSPSLWIDDIAYSDEGDWIGPYRNPFAGWGAPI